MSSARSSRLSITHLALAVLISSIAAVHAEVTNIPTAHPAGISGIADCNHNDQPDNEDLTTPDHGDCNNNGIPDGCDIDQSDPDGNGVISLDHNCNGRPDECDLEGRLMGVGIDINVTTGHATRLPPLLGVGVGEIAFSPDGTFYGRHNQTVSIIDAKTWTTTKVVELDSFIGRITFSPDGTLFGVKVAANNVWELAKADLETGAVTIIGQLAPGYENLRGIAFSPDGTLYAVDHWNPEPPQEAYLLTINPKTGGATQVAVLAQNPFDSVIEDLAFSADGTFYTVHWSDASDLGPATQAELVRTSLNGAALKRIRLPFRYPPWNVEFAPDGTVYAYGGNDAPSAGLMTIDLETGHCRGINGVRLSSSGIAYSPIGALYTAGSRLSVIDVNTGAATILSLLKPSRRAHVVNDLAICPDGAAYGINTDSDDDRDSSYLSRVDLRAGSARNYINSFYPYWRLTLNISCDPQSTLFAIRENNSDVDTNHLYMINKNTGALTPVTTLDTPVKSLAFTPDGTHYAVDGTSLMTVDIETGATHTIGLLGIPVNDIAYVPPGYAPPQAALGDANCDARVNLVDLRAMTQCMSRPGPNMIAVCAAFDFNHDGRVDLIDYAEFLGVILDSPRRVD